MATTFWTRFLEKINQSKLEGNYVKILNQIEKSQSFDFVFGVVLPCLFEQLVEDHLLEMVQGRTATGNLMQIFELSGHSFGCL